jgi:hypothetical protein
MMGWWQQRQQCLQHPWQQQQQQPGVQVRMLVANNPCQRARVLSYTHAPVRLSVGFSSWFREHPNMHVVF